MNLDAKYLNVQELECNEAREYQGGYFTIAGVTTFLKLAVLTVEFFSGSFHLGKDLYEFFHPKAESKMA